MNSLSKHGLVFGAGFVAGMLAMFLSTSSSMKELQSAAPDAAKHEVKDSAPIKAFDKKELEKRDLVSSKVAKNDNLEVTAVSKVETDSGTSNIAATLDKKTGNTSLTTTRPFMEFMDRQEIGVGVGLYDGTFAKVVQYRPTFCRVWNFYCVAQVDLYEVDRESNRHPWDAFVLATLRF